ncbi:MAG: M23 family metallopeptidase, partial [Leptolinea sp.]
MKNTVPSKTGLLRFVLPILIVIFLVLGLGTAYLAYQIFLVEPAAEQVFPKYSQPKDMATAQLEQSLQVAMQRHPDVLAYLIYRVSISNVTYTEDKNLALLWLSLFEKETDTLVPAEPGLAIAQRGADGTWAVTVQADAEYYALLLQIPTSMLDEETRAQYLSEPQPLSKGIDPLHGYRLPWKKGITKFLTGSIGHVLTYKSCPSSCMYAFDFADGGNFPIMAAKGGLVKYAVWKFADNNHTNANYIILEDPSTNPVTYQVYFHLSQDSIPAALRTPGAWVNQGQFIGNVDNTGYSSGPHLHFHVHTNPTSFWGNSVDIVFDDVSVNGGRPRTCTEVAAFPTYGNQCMPGDKYTSNNGDSKPPTGVLSAPATNTVVTTAAVPINGYGLDESGVTRIQPMVKYDGIWRPAGPAITTEAFVADLNLCNAGVPDGPVSIGLDIWDTGGNKTTTPVGEVVIRKQHTCPANPPACTPGDDQVALYNNANYQGYCKLVSPSEISDMASLIDFGDNNLESIQIGGTVSAILFDDSNFSGRTQALNVSQPDLSNILIGTNRVSSIKVVKVLPVPTIPVLNPVAGPNGAALTADDSITLSWLPAAGALDYHAELKGADGFSAVQDWQTGVSYSIGSLKPGNYQWVVFARNGVGEKSVSANFVVQPGKTETGTPIASPYEAGFGSNVSGWSATGSWQRIGFKLNAESQTGWVFGNASSFANGESVASGELTSPPIFVGYAGQQFTFNYAAATESSGPVWDQRHVQISIDGAPFQELMQLSAETTGGKLIESKPVDLTSYARKSIRLRFHFSSIDGLYNDGLGWAINSMRVSEDIAKVCKENTDDGSSDKARPSTLGSSVDAQLCPTGDLDYYSFAGTEKQPFTATINLTSPVKGWTPALALVDSDGKTTLADGKLSGNSAQMNTILPRTGTYYLKISVQAPDKATVPGVDYRLSLVQDTTLPTVKLTKPTAGNISLTLPIALSAEAADAGNPVSRVEFYIQPAGVSIDKADQVGSDDNGQDGWN